MNDSQLHAHVVVKTSNLVVSRRRYAEDLKIFAKIRAARAARLFMIFYPMISFFCGVVVADAVVVS